MPEPQNPSVAQPSSAEPSPDSIPAKRPRRAWAALFVASGVIIAGLLLIVVANISNPANEAQVDESFEDIRELIVPPAVPEDILAHPGAGTTNQDVQPLLNRGAWIQVADEDGQLAQQYRCQSLTPNPEGKPTGWFEMQRPEAEIFLSDGRVMKLTGDSGLAYSPHRRLEEGTLTGNVRIRVVEYHAGDGSNEIVVLDVTTSEASFDSVSGQMLCPNDVMVRAQRIDLDGRGLQLLFDDRQDVFRLSLDEVDQIIVLAETNTADDEPNPENHPASPTSPASEPTSVDNRAVAIANPSPPPATSVQTPDRTTDAHGPGGVTKPPSSPAANPIPFYELVLRDNVRVEETDTAIRRIATADELRMVFTFESEGLSDTVVQNRPTDNDVVATTAHQALIMGDWRQRLATSAVIATHTDTRRRLVIHCSGPLTVKPVSNPNRILQSPNDTRLTLTGAPVRVEDLAETTVIECAEICYDTIAGPVNSGPGSEIVRLSGSNDIPFTLRNPDTLATGDGFTLDITQSSGRLDGTGTMTWRDVNNPDAGPLDINWSDGVDLAFHEQTGDGNSLALGELRSATFIGDVHVNHTEFTLDAENMTVELDENPDGSSTFRTLLASGDARAIGLIEGDALRADDLRLDFFTTPGTDAVPERLIATGHVEAVQETQILWTDLLDVEFAPTDEIQPDGTTAVDVKTLVARGAVQILLNDGTRVFADDLQADAQNRGAVLTGDTMQLIQDRLIIDQAHRLTLDELAGTFTLPGRGRLRVFDRAIVAPDASERLALVSVERRDDMIEDLRVLWNDHAQFTANSDQTGGLATFTGDVAVRGRDIALDHAKTLTARFTDRDDQTQLDQIEAHAAVGTPLAMMIRQVDSTQAAPTISEQHLSASMLTVILDPNRSQDAPGTPGAESVLVRSFTAEDDVRIRLVDGTTVFADRVIGFPQTSTADLHGVPVSIVTGTTLLRCEPSVRLVDHGDSIDLLGAGQLATYEEPIAIPSQHRFDAQAQSGRTQLLASWTDSATYVPTDEIGLSVIDLRGAVHVDARPDPLEMVRVDSEALTLEFEETDDDQALTNDATGVRGNNQHLSRLVAVGAAKLENVAWQRAEDVGQQDLARVFYVSGDHVAFNNAAGSAQVAGAGELLIHDTWQAASSSEASTTDFTSSGTTLFRWQDEMELTPTAGDLSEVVMRGGVQLLHRDLHNETATVTADRIEATITRSRDAGGSLSFDTGGHAELDRVRGIDNVFIRTTTRDISCGMFEYQMDRIAELIAAPNGVVVVRTRGESGSMVANHLRWDLVEDRITVVGATGSGG